MKNWIIKKLGGFTKKELEEELKNNDKGWMFIREDWLGEIRKLQKKLLKHEHIPSDAERIKYNKWLNDELNETKI